MIIWTEVYLTHVVHDIGVSSFLTKMRNYSNMFSKTNKCKQKVNEKYSS